MPSLITTGGGLSYTTYAEGTLTADGTEQTVFSETPDSPKIYNGWISLDNMQAGDVVTLRTYVDGEIHANQTYDDAIAQPKIGIDEHITGQEFKVTIEQTAGTNRDFPYKILRA